MKKTAIIVDDEIAGLEHLSRLLNTCADVQLLASTTIPEEAIELITKNKPDILFLDIEMPRISGFEVLEITRNQGLIPYVVFTTAYSQYAIKAIKENAFDYLLKPIDIEELRITLDRIDEVVNTPNLYPNNLTRILSRRELQILELIVEGKTSKEIGEELFISKVTVDTHRRNILEKTKAKSTADLIATILLK
ncbi:MAG: hypothetical protein C0595_12475 [Marinilabiliales bacterium]|nr:MAG: hypothetical protein C0595_12475 [Marinilabiliales bacterium]